MRRGLRRASLSNIKNQIVILDQNIFYLCLRSMQMRIIEDKYYLKYNDAVGNQIDKLTDTVIINLNRTLFIKRIAQ